MLGVEYKQRRRTIKTPKFGSEYPKSLTDSFLKIKQYRQRSTWGDLKYKSDGNYDKLPNQQKIRPFLCPCEDK
jgi:hypothetical protein